MNLLGLTEKTETYTLWITSRRMYTEGIVKGPERKLFRLSDGPYPTTFVLKTYNGPLD